MKVGPELSKILNKIYAPNEMIHQRFSRYDLAFKTDDEGRPIQLFIGKADENGNIVGERFVRRLHMDDKGIMIKDHWDNKGKCK